MESLLSFIGAFLLANLLFRILFLGLEKSLIKPFSGLQQYVQRLKRPKLIYYFTLVLFVLVMSMGIEDQIYAYVIYGMTFGFILALLDNIFGDLVKKR